MFMVNHLKCQANKVLLRWSIHSTSHLELRIRRTLFSIIYCLSSMEGMDREGTRLVWLRSFLASPTIHPQHRKHPKYHNKDKPYFTQVAHHNQAWFSRSISRSPALSCRKYLSRYSNNNNSSNSNNNNSSSSNSSSNNNNRVPQSKHNHLSRSKT